MTSFVRAPVPLLFALAFLIGGCGGDNIFIGGTPTPSRTATTTPTPTATPLPPLTSEAVLRAGPFGVGVMTVSYEDPSRPTMPNRTYPGAPTRRLVTEIWYPIEAAAAELQRDAPLALTGRPFPLIMYSHGFLSFRTEGGSLARHLASYGYVVASPDFPLTNSQAPGGPNLADVVEQPRDVSFLIDRLVARSAAAGDDWAGAIDTQRIGLTGVSLGGLTTFLTAFHPTLRDPRVRAAAPIAGVACFFGSSFFDHAQLPLMIVHGDIDAIVPYPQNALTAFGGANAPKYLVTVAGGSHTAFTDAGELFESLNNADDVGCAALRGQTGGGETDLLDRLGGAEAGIVSGGCPAACAGPRPLPRAIRPSRQRQLEMLSILPFFEATLRGDAAARTFIEERLAMENAELTVDRDLGQ